MEASSTPRSTGSMAASDRGNTHSTSSIASSQCSPKRGLRRTKNMTLLPRGSSLSPRSRSPLRESVGIYPTSTVEARQSHAVSPTSSPDRDAPPVRLGHPSRPYYSAIRKDMSRPTSPVFSIAAPRTPSPIPPQLDYVPRGTKSLDCGDRSGIQYARELRPMSMVLSGQTPPMERTNMAVLQNPSDPVSSRLSVQPVFTPNSKLIPNPTTCCSPTGVESPCGSVSEASSRSNRYSIAEQALVSALKHSEEERSPLELQIYALQRATVVLSTHAKESRERAAKLKLSLTERGTEPSVYVALQQERWMEEKRRSAVDKEMEMLTQHLSRMKADRGSDQHDDENHPSSPALNNEAQRSANLARVGLLLTSHSHVECQWATFPPTASGHRPSPLLCDVSQRNMHVHLSLAGEAFNPVKRPCRPRPGNSPIDIHPLTKGTEYGAKAHSISDRSVSSRSSRLTIEATHPDGSEGRLSTRPSTPPLSVASEGSSSSQGVGEETGGIATIISHVTSRTRSEILADLDKDAVHVPEYAVNLLGGFDLIHDEFSLPDRELFIKPREMKPIEVAPPPEPVDAPPPSEESDTGPYTSFALPPFTVEPSWSSHVSLHSPPSSTPQGLLHRPSLQPLTPDSSRFPVRVVPPLLGLHRAPKVLGLDTHFSFTCGNTGGILGSTALLRLSYLYPFQPPKQTLVNTLTSLPSRWNMSQKKQTARKTTGKHLLLSSALSPAPPPTPARRQSKKRVQHRPPPKSPLKLKSILKRPSAAVAPLPALLVPTAPSFASSYIDIDIPDDPEPVSFLSDAPPSASGTVADPAPGPGPGAGAGAGPLIAWRRPALHVLDKPISVCMRFATWLESEKCVHEDALARAVERDGRPFLSLAKATVMFDDALRGRVPLTRTVNGGATGPFGDHARTLRVFAELLKNKISEGNLSAELEAAVLRDGEPLLRLAVCCLELDQAMRGSDGTAGS
ncbi:hypothetical protein JVT61DRAFT_14108 [Boletus reticuloceps]|uniref:Uncharacterized protein n=1 Tax=Boletus reticuloceps TaxID=495285 RepID=A0A8I3A2K4_9AGAM|nr:hypothetical protein JVT61DRAFT_14108 [Boletus reticuloceps]